MISIIIPVYQSVRTLKRCTDSIQKQTYSNWEAILIDDGSNDGSEILCDVISKQDSRFRVIHTNNQGAATARNLGIQMAKGEYLAFADSDDWMEPKMLEILKGMFLTNQIDCVSCGYYLHLRNGKVSQTIKFLSKKPLQGDDAIKALLQKQYYRGFLWNKMFSVKTVCKNRYSLILSEDLKVCEDLYFLFYLLTKGMKIQYIPYPLYHHYNHSDSLMGKFDQYRLTELKAYEKMKQEPEISSQIQRLLCCREGEAAINLMPYVLLSGDKALAKKLWQQGRAILIPFCLCNAFTIYEKIRMIQIFCFPVFTIKLLNFFRGY